MVIINFCGKSGVSSSPDKVSFSLSCIHGDNVVSLRCRKTVDMGSLGGLYAIYTGIKYDSIRFLYKSKRLQENDTVGSAGIVEGDVIHVLQVVDVVDYEHYEKWTLATN